MKILIITALVCLSAFANGQNKPVFLKHDTITLRASQCNWLIPAELKPTDKSIKANSVTEWFLEAITQGKLNATDPQTNVAIPPGKIKTWKAAADTVLVLDPAGEKATYKIEIAEINPSHLSVIKLQQDWYMDTSSGKISSQVKWVQLMKEHRDASGQFIAFVPYCRIDY
jgi:hypothetical protein